MIDLLEETRRLLSSAGMTTTLLEENQQRRRAALAFESTTVLGFVCSYATAGELLAGWADDTKTLISQHQLSLRRAKSKAWNAYTVLLAGGVANYAERIAISAIEEDLTGTRKIARASINDPEDVRLALLSLLPIHNAPRLDPVDMSAEIRLRTTQLPGRVVDAFLSEAQEAIVARVLEEEQ